MVAVCQQPNYFPWLGYLEQCARADALIVLDSVQWIRRGCQHRARVLRHESDATTTYQWLTLPVRGHAHRQKALRDLELAHELPWARWHWNAVRTIYGRRPYFKTQVEPLVRPWLERYAYEKSLSVVLLASLQLCLEALDLRPRVVFSSQLAEKGIKTERLVSLCKAVGADVYYSGIASTRYIDLSKFRDAGIRVVWQHWRHPEYAQGRATFKSHLSFLDALANVRLDEIAKMLRPKVALAAYDQLR